MARLTAYLSIALLVAAAGNLIVAQNGDPTTETVAEPVSLPAPLSGTVHAPHRTELKLGFEAFSGDVRIKTLVAPGMVVEEGAAIATVELVDAAEVFEEAAEAAELAQLNFVMAEEALRRHNEGLPHQLERARISLERAEEALVYYRETERDRRIRSNEISLEQSRNSIKDQEEELEQLERLYQGNDLAKESQDIVLNRARRRLEVSKERLEMEEEAHERLVEVTLPRREQDLEAGVVSARDSLERLEHLHEHGNVDLISRLQRARRSADQARERAENLEADMQRTELKAPHAGLVVLGAFSGNDGVTARHRVDDEVSAGAVIATLVDHTRLETTVRVPLNRRVAFQPGAKVHVRNGDLGDAVPGRVVALGGLVNDGSVAARIEVDNSSGTLLPGASVEVTPVPSEE
jgi:hypothetical protein